MKRSAPTASSAVADGATARPTTSNRAPADLHHGSLPRDRVSLHSVSATTTVRETFLPSVPLPTGPTPDEYPRTMRLGWVVALFTVGGGVATAPFSLALARLMTRDTFTQALAKGMVIPLFTWFVQLCVTAWWLRGVRRYEYAVHLGVVCTLGSIALWPAAGYNLVASHPSPWVSVVNVYASVWLMFLELARRNRVLGLPRWLAPFFLATIHVNMALFATSALTTAFDGFFHLMF